MGDLVAERFDYVERLYHPFAKSETNLVLKSMIFSDSKWGMCVKWEVGGKVANGGKMLSGCVNEPLHK
jgi:hypothetical protein